MSSFNLDVYMPVAILFVFGILFVVVALLVGILIRPKKPTQLKSEIYECGEIPITKAWSAFNIRFYVIGLIFIIFDVEAALMFPVAAVFKKMTEAGAGMLLLIEVLIFLFILIISIGSRLFWRRDRENCYILPTIRVRFILTSPCWTI